MVKMFCDVCSKEITRNYVNDRVEVKKIFPNGVEVQVEILVAVKKVWNGGELCQECLLQVVNKDENSVTK